MSDLMEAAAASIPLRIDGEAFTFAPLTLGDYAKLHAAVKGHKASQILQTMESVKRLPRHLQETAMCEVVKQMAAAANPTPADMATYQASPEGIFLRLSLMLRGSHPEFSDVKAVEEKFGSMSEKTLAAIIQAVETTDDEGEPKN